MKNQNFTFPTSPFSIVHLLLLFDLPSSLLPLHCVFSTLSISSAPRTKENK